jgi:hypothetical protein
MVSLIQEEPALLKTCQSSDRADISIKERLLKMGAAIYTATARHGAYERIH